MPRNHFYKLDHSAGAKLAHWVYLANLKETKLELQANLNLEEKNLNENPKESLLNSVQ